MTISDPFGPPRQVLHTIYEISEQALEELALWFEQRGWRTPASQITGLRAATGIYSGTGSPETVVTAPVGSLYRRLDGGAVTTLYVKESGTSNVGWVAK